MVLLSFIRFSNRLNGRKPAFAVWVADFVRRSPLRRAKAEREGFKPPVPCGTPDFESGTFDHSDTSPGIIY